MEYFDLYTPEGSLLQQKASRSEAHAKGLWHKTVHIWIRDTNNNILMQKRSAHCENNPSLWDIAVAGHITAGQTSLEAAVRECQEEIGLSLQTTDLQYLFTTKHQHAANGYIDNEFQDVYEIIMPTSEIDFTLDPQEVESIKWFTVEECKTVLFDNTLFVSHPEEYKKILEHFSDTSPIL